MKELIILIDNEDNFLISVEDLKIYKSMKINEVRDHFIKEGYRVNIVQYSKIDLSLDYKDKFVLYQTSESPGGFYKSYIEDIIFYLESQGAIVLPKFKYLKAHHNKVFMEILRNEFVCADLKTIKSKFYGCYEEAIMDIPVNYPVVIKQSAGSGSTGVALANNKEEYLKQIRTISNVIYTKDVLRLLKDTISLIIGKKALNRSTLKRSEKVVVQNFIQGLSGDYKVLYFYGKYYVLYRENRENDFRASGSGKFVQISVENEKKVLSFAHRITKEIDFPIIGMDIGFDGERYHLIEYQMIHIGPYTLQASQYWYEYTDTDWVRKEGSSNLEEEFSRSIVDYIENKYKG